MHFTTKNIYIHLCIILFPLSIIPFVSTSDTPSMVIESVSSIETPIFDSTFLDTTSTPELNFIDLGSSKSTYTTTKTSLAITSSITTTVDSKSSDNIVSVSDSSLPVPEPDPSQFNGPNTDPSGPFSNQNKGLVYDNTVEYNDNTVEYNNNPVVYITNKKQEKKKSFLDKIYDAFRYVLKVLFFVLCILCFLLVLYISIRVHLAHRHLDEPFDVEELKRETDEKFRDLGLPPIDWEEAEREFAEPEAGRQFDNLLDLMEAPEEDNLALFEITKILFPDEEIDQVFSRI